MSLFLFTARQRLAARGASPSLGPPSVGRARAFDDFERGEMP